MSREKVSLVRALVASWNSGDIDALTDAYDEEIVMTMAEGWPEPGPFIGREAVIGQVRRMRETFEGSNLEPVSGFTEIGDQVVVRLAWRGAGRGPELNMEGSIVYTVRAGTLDRLQFFWDHAEALAVAGRIDVD